MPHLADSADAVQGQGAVDLDAGARFLERSAPRAFLDGFAMLQIAGGDGPVAAPRFYGPAAQQDPAIM